MRQAKFVLTALLLGCVVSTAQAVQHDIAFKSYALAGEIKAKGILKCGPVALSGGAPVTMGNSVTMQFGAGGGTGSTFQLFNDNIFTGSSVDGLIYERKGNRLTLQYAGAATPEEAAGQFVDMAVAKAKQKAAELGFEFPDAAFTISSYKFKGNVRKDSVAISEKVVLIATDLPRKYKACSSAKLTVTRKLKGTQIIPE
jgi:hypothetical protein